MATLTFNVAILTVLSIGLIIVFQSASRLVMLAGTFGIMAYKKGSDLEYYLKGIDGIMPATIAHMFNKRAKVGVLYFTKDEAKDVTTWLEEQFFNSKGYISFFVGTSLMIGLFGTFAGLLIAIDDMGAIILSLGGDIDLGEIMAGFAGPLGGMAIGFGSSLFGVAVAIILNFMQYILSRNQANFIEDIEDWLKGKLIESQSSEVISQINSTLYGDRGEVQNGTQSSTAPAIGGASQGMGGFIDTFASKMGEFSEQMEKYNQSNENIYEIISNNLKENSEKNKEEMVFLEGMSNSLKELNVNQFSNTALIEESVNGVSTVAIGKHKTIKHLLTAQEENNKLLNKLIDTIELNSKK